MTSARSLTPDLARGFAMFGVVLANASLYASHQVESRTDAASEFLVTWLVEGRSWPMFALMFGFGVAMLSASLERRGHDRRTVNRTLRRRCWWLLAFGAVQSTFWFGFDILGAYAVTTLLLIFLLRHQAVVWWAVGTMALAANVLSAVAMGLLLSLEETVPDGTLSDGSGATLLESPDYLVSIGDRLLAFGITVPVSVISMTAVTAMLIGFAHHRIGSLTSPSLHLPLHRRIAGGGLLIGLLGGLPWAAVDAGWWTPSASVAGLLFGLHVVSGVAQGTAYVSLVALLAARWEEQPRGAATWVTAAGSRSLTVYLAHGLLLAVFLTPWGLGLGERLPLAGVYGFAVGVWIVCVSGARMLQQAGRPGPADALLRRLTYRRLPESPAESPPESPAEAPLASPSSRTRDRNHWSEDAPATRGRHE